MGSIVLAAEYSDTMSHMGSHFHDCHQLIYLSQGQVKISVSGKTYLAKPGTLLLISRFEEHSIQVESEQYHRYTLRVSPNSSDWDTFPGEPLLSLLVNRPEHFQHAVDLSHFPNAVSIFRQIVEEKKYPHPFGDKMLELLFLQLLILVYRAHPEMIAEAETDLHLIRQIQQQFENRYSEKYTLSSLSRQHHLSPSYLSHLFRKVTGTSVMGYLNSCRYAAAKRYLAETDLEIGRIVELCGFSDNSNFSRSFKTATGMTPSEFRISQNTAKASQK